MLLGIIMNELMINSLKYGIMLNYLLKIDIYLQFCVDGFCLEYWDNGLGFLVGIMGEWDGGLGFYLLKSMVC